MPKPPDAPLPEPSVPARTGKTGVKNTTEKPEVTRKYGRKEQGRPRKPDAKGNIPNTTEQPLRKTRFDHPERAIVTPEEAAAARERFKRGPGRPPSSPGLMSADRNKLKLATSVFGHNIIGYKSFYNTMYHSRQMRLEPHLEAISYALTDERIRRAIISIGPGSGKSQAISIAYPALRLGTDPTHTILGISAGENLMQGFQGAVMEWIENSPEWRTLFPHVRPDKNKGWSTDGGCFVTGHPDGDPDASYFACGLESKKLTGVHARTIICDDLHDETNSASAEACQRVVDKYNRQIRGRADPRGARFIMAGRRWSEHDVYGYLARTGEWVVMNLPAMRDETSVYWDITIPDGLECCFTEMIAGKEPQNMGDADLLKKFLEKQKQTEMAAHAAAVFGQPQ